MAKSFWTAGMIDTALEHIEQHKGQTGLYKIDKDAALDDLSAVLYKQYSLKVTKQQLDSQLYEIWQNHQRNRNTRISKLFLKGRSCLDSYCDRSVLLSRKKELGLDTPLAEQLVTEQALSKRRIELVAHSSLGNRDRATLESQRSTPDPRNNFQDALVAPSSSKRSRQIATAGKARASVTPDSRNLKRTLRSSQGSSKSEVQNRSKTDVRSEGSPTNESEEETGENTIRGAKSRRYQIQTPISPIPAPESRNLIRHIEDFMLKDPLSFTPTQNELVSLVDSIFKLIILLERHFDAQVESHMNLLTFLRALIAVAVNEWVLKGQHMPLPSAFSERSLLMQRYEQTVAEVSPRLHEQISRKANELFIRQDLHPELYMRQLTLRLYGALQEFMLGTFSNCNLAGMRFLRENLDKVFGEALKLRGLVSLRNDELFFRWIFFDHTFEPRSMRCEGNGHVVGGKVQLCLWPALIQKEISDSIQDEAEETALVQAVVTLQ